MQFSQTVEDHILASAVISLCNRMGPRLSEFGPSSRKTIDTAYKIAQERHKQSIFKGSEFILGPKLRAEKNRVADLYLR